MGCRRLTNSRVNVTAGRIILDASCVVSAPLPTLSGPPLARGHLLYGGGTFLSNPEGSPSAVRGLLTERHRTLLYLEFAYTVADRVATLSTVSCQRPTAIPDGCVVPDDIGDSSSSGEH